MAIGKFYPDSVAELIDGRFLVVEYKGARWVSAGDEVIVPNMGGRIGGSGGFVSGCGVPQCILLFRVWPSPVTHPP